MAIAISKANPLGEIGWLLQCVHLYVFFPKKREIRYKELFPNTHFDIGLYSRFSCFIGITFNNVTFLFEINHDDGTVKHILNHLLAIYELYINRHLIYRHMATTSINYKPLYCFV